MLFCASLYDLINIFSSRTGCKVENQHFFQSTIHSGQILTDELSGKKLEAFGRLLKIMDELREQCPWDKKQTFISLRNLTIEETYELADALLENDLKGIKEEVGICFFTWFMQK
jgi:XTP/dITP diphosphohydrolase